VVEAMSQSVIIVQPINGLGNGHTCGSPRRG
jgi:hypothetical protein